MRSDRAFLRTLARAEGEMNALFAQLAHDVGDIVLRSAGPDGTVPIERLREIQLAANRLVDAAMLGPSGRPFDNSARPQSRYAEVLQRGQLAMIDLALERQAKVLDRLMPVDVREAMRVQQEQA